MKFRNCLSIFLIIFSSLIAQARNISDIVVNYTNGNINKAYHLASNHGEKDIAKFLKSQQFLDKANNCCFEDITHFLNLNPEWPQHKTLITIAENRLNDKTNKAKIISWFDHHKPLTAKGYYYYYKAALIKVKDTKKLNQIIIDAWVNSEFNYNETKFILNKFAPILTQDIHAQKIETLLWKGKTKEAINLLPLVDKNYQLGFKAWISIITGQHNKEEFKFHHVKGSYRYISGLLYSYLNLHKKNEPNAELIRLYLHAPDDVKHAKEWWKLKLYFVRELIKTKDYKNAYIIASKHNLAENIDIVEAEWIAGWLVFRHLNNPTKAIAHFEKLYKSSKSSISLARGAYWLGRCYSSKNQKEQAISWYKTAAKFGFTFYGQLAQTELGYKTLKLENTLATPPAKGKANEFAKIAKFLSYTSQFELTKLYSKHAFKAAHSPTEIINIMDSLAPQLNLSQKADIAKLAQQQGVLIPKYSHPNPFKFNRPPVEVPFIYSIIRQETIFDQNAISKANAHGLMQVLPSTAKILAGELGIKFDVKKLTKDPYYNIKLGSYYLAQTIDNFNGSYIMAFAGYNAGPHKLPQWISIFGDPRTMKFHQVIDWIESVPFYETRDYIQRVSENLQVYRAILNKSAPLKIKEDLTRG